MSSIENKNENVNVTISETVVTNNNKTQDLTQYSNRPDTPAILDILAERKKAGNLDKTFPIDLEYLLELREFWNIKTCMTFEQFERGPEHLRDAEAKVRLLTDENRQLRDKIKELLEENSLGINKITELRQELGGAHLIKLPLRKVNAFLMLTPDDDLSSDDSVFYVKTNEQGQMERIVRSIDELSASI